MKTRTFFALCTLLVFCFSGCADADVRCPPGEEIENCVCYTLYEPVCGCDKVTYSNQCWAKCSGVDHWRKGKCW